MIMNKRKVIVYQDLRSFKNTDVYHKLKELPQIASQANLIKAFYGLNDISSVNAKVFSSVQKELLPTWSSAFTKLRMLSSIREYVRERIETAIVNNRQELEWLIGCRKNIPDVVDSVRTLVECGLTPEDLSSLAAHNHNFELLKGAWEHLENDESLYDLHKSLEWLSEKTVMRLTLDSLFEGEHYFPSQTKCIVVHGFLYVKPLQEKIFRMIEDSGISLIFLAQYDRRYPYMFECWDHTFSKDNYDTYWVYSETDTEPIYPLGEYSLGTNRQKHYDFSNIYYEKYSSTLDFSRSIRRIGTISNIYSSAQQETDKILRTFAPEFDSSNQEKPLLSYPIGQFILELFSTWDPDHVNSKGMLEPCSIIDFDKMEKLMATGWISTSNGVSSRDLLTDYIRVKTIFRTCKLVKDWIAKLSELVDLTDNCHLDVEQDRWQRIEGDVYHSWGTVSLNQ